MEEKERYEIYKDNRENSYICDTSKNVDYKTYQEFVDLLNQQDKRIKELQEKLSSVYDDTNESLRFAKDSLQKLIKENQQLKQQLHDLPKKIVEEISKELKSLYKNYPIIYSENKDIVKSCYDKDSVNKILDTILKKYGEKIWYI